MNCTPAYASSNYMSSDSQYSVNRQDNTTKLSIGQACPVPTNGWNPRASMAFDNAKGLLNPVGHNNCFLNSAIQVLWHLDAFRRNFRLLSGHTCFGDSCIFCALKELFDQYQFSNSSVLPPDKVRDALAKTFADQQRYQIGFMDDAAECFENILMRLHVHLAYGIPDDVCQESHCISHQKFSMTVVEQAACQCGATSEPFSFYQLVHYASTNAIMSGQAEGQTLSFYHKDTETAKPWCCSLNSPATATKPSSRRRHAAAAVAAVSFGRLLSNAVSEEESRLCPKKCGGKMSMLRTLVNTPDVISVGLVWESDQPGYEHICRVMTSIDTVLYPAELFHCVADTDWAVITSFQLVGLVCYYGQHYSTFFFHSKMKIWLLFDDSKVKKLKAEWKCVVDRCCRGRYQPLLLLYANPAAEPLDTTRATEVVTRINNGVPCTDRSAARRSYSLLPPRDQQETVPVSLQRQSYLNAVCELNEDFDSDHQSTISSYTDLTCTSSHHSDSNGSEKLFPAHTRLGDRGSVSSQNRFGSLNDLKGDTFNSSVSSERSVRSAFHSETSLNLLARQQQQQQQNDPFYEDNTDKSTSITSDKVKKLLARQMQHGGKVAGTKQHIQSGYGSLPRHVTTRLQSVATDVDCHDSQSVCSYKDSGYPGSLLSGSPTLSASTSALSLRTSGSSDGQLLATHAINLAGSGVSSAGSGSKVSSSNADQKYSVNFPSEKKLPATFGDLNSSQPPPHVLTEPTDVVSRTSESTRQPTRVNNRPRDVGSGAAPVDRPSEQFSKSTEATRHQSESASISTTQVAEPRHRSVKQLDGGSTSRPVKTDPLNGTQEASEPRSKPLNKPAAENVHVKQQIEKFSDVIQQLRFDGVQTDRIHQSSSSQQNSAVSSGNHQFVSVEKTSSNSREPVWSSSSGNRRMLQSNSEQVVTETFAAPHSAKEDSRVEELVGKSRQVAPSAVISGTSHVPLQHQQQPQQQTRPVANVDRKQFSKKYPSDVDRTLPYDDDVVVSNEQRWYPNNTSSAFAAGSDLFAAGGYPSAQSAYSAGNYKQSQQSYFHNYNPAYTSDVNNYNPPMKTASSNYSSYRGTSHANCVPFQNSNPAAAATVAAAAVGPAVGYESIYKYNPVSNNSTRGQPSFDDDRTDLATELLASNSSRPPMYPYRGDPTALVPTATAAASATTAGGKAVPSIVGRRCITPVGRRGNSSMSEQVRSRTPSVGRISHSSSRNDDSSVLDVSLQQQQTRGRSREAGRGIPAVLSGEGTVSGRRLKSSNSNKPPPWK